MTDARDTDDLVHSIRRHAVALAGTDPGGDLDDLAPIGDALAGADVVGLGEATHRTREFVRLRHRLVRYLVERRGLRLLGLEAQFAEAMALHDYVVRGRGDAVSALDDLVLTVYDTEETVAFLRWLRSFNEGRPPGDRVAVYGFDVQSAAGPAAALREHVADHHDGRAGADEVRESLAALEAGVVEGYDVDENRLRTGERIVARLDEWFETDGHAGPSLARGYHLALEGACAFARAVVEGDVPERFGTRDERMVRLVEWMLDYEGADRVAVLAHNNHVKHGTFSGGGHPAETMGERLAARFGEGYYALGTQFGDGTVRAHVPVGDGEDDYRMRELSVPAPEEGTVPWLFDKADPGIAFLDLRSLPGGPLRDCLDAERPHRFVAGVVDPDDDRPFCRTHDALASFDGLVHVAEATPTTTL